MTLLHTTDKSYVVDYFLDGYYLKSEGILQDHKPDIEEIIIVSLPDSKDRVEAQVVEIHDISEDEYHIFLISLDGEE